MVLERLKQLASQISLHSAPPHPFDPLSSHEIETAVSIIKQEKGDHFYYNAVTLWEPRKKQMLAYLAGGEQRPTRVAEIVAIGSGSKVFDGLVDLEARKVIRWDLTEGVQPLITMEDLKVVEIAVRKDPKVIQQCEISGVPRSDMHKVYCDPWTIGFDERFGSTVRLQQALMYYRPHVDDSQYAYPFDFCPIYDADKGWDIHDGCSARGLLLTSTQVKSSTSTSPKSAAPSTAPVRATSTLQL